MVDITHHGDGSVTVTPSKGQTGGSGVGSSGTYTSESAARSAVESGNRVGVIDPVKNNSSSHYGTGRNIVTTNPFAPSYDPVAAQNLGGRSQFDDRAPFVPPVQYPPSKLMLSDTPNRSYIDSNMRIPSVDGRTSFMTPSGDRFDAPTSQYDEIIGAGGSIAPFVPSRDRADVVWETPEQLELKRSILENPNTVYASTKFYEDEYVETSLYGSIKPQEMVYVAKSEPFDSSILTPFQLGGVSQGGLFQVLEDRKYPSTPIEPIDPPQYNSILFPVYQAVDKFGQGWQSGIESRINQYPVPSVVKESLSGFASIFTGAPAWVASAPVGAEAYFREQGKYASQAQAERKTTFAYMFDKGVEQMGRDFISGALDSPARAAGMIAGMFVLGKAPSKVPKMTSDIRFAFNDVRASGGFPIKRDFKPTVAQQAALDKGDWTKTSVSERGVMGMRFGSKGYRPNSQPKPESGLLADYHRGSADLSSVKAKSEPAYDLKAHDSGVGGDWLSAKNKASAEFYSKNPSTVNTGGFSTPDMPMLAVKSETVRSPALRPVQELGSPVVSSGLLDLKYPSDLPKSGLLKGKYPRGGSAKRMAAYQYEPSSVYTGKSHASVRPDAKGNYVTPNLLKSGRLRQNAEGVYKTPNFLQASKSVASKSSVPVLVFGTKQDSELGVQNVDSVKIGSSPILGSSFKERMSVNPVDRSVTGSKIGFRQGSKPDVSDMSVTDTFQEPVHSNRPDVKPRYKAFPREVSIPNLRMIPKWKPSAKPPRIPLKDKSSEGGSSDTVKRGSPKKTVRGRSGKNVGWYPASLESVTLEEFRLGGKERARHMKGKRSSNKAFSRLLGSGSSIPTASQSRSRYSGKSYNKYRKVKL